jgi:hypothetical protein
VLLEPPALALAALAQVPETVVAAPHSPEAVAALPVQAPAQVAARRQCPESASSLAERSRSHRQVRFR